MIYQSIQELAQVLNADASAFVFNKTNPEDQNNWHLVIHLSSGDLKIEAEANGEDFRETLLDLKQKMIQTIIEIQSMNESHQERSRKVDIMANESYKYTLH
jgi:hypothetical protein